MFAIYQSCFRKRFRLTTVIASGIALALFFWRGRNVARGGRHQRRALQCGGRADAEQHLCGASLTLQGDCLDQHSRSTGARLPEPDSHHTSAQQIATSKKPDAYTPLGSLNSYVSFNLNFGLLGSALFLFLWPMLFRYLRSRSAATLPATMYVMCSGWLAFTFFRDPFSISLVKAIFRIHPGADANRSLWLFFLPHVRRPRLAATCLPNREWRICSSSDGDADSLRSPTFFPAKRGRGFPYFFELLRYVGKIPDVEAELLVGMQSSAYPLRTLSSANLRITGYDGPAVSGIWLYVANELFSNVVGLFRGKMDIYHPTLYRSVPLIRTRRVVATHHDCTRRRFPQEFAMRKR